MKRAVAPARARRPGGRCTAMEVVLGCMVAAVAVAMVGMHATVRHARETRQDESGGGYDGHVQAARLGQQQQQQQHDGRRRVEASERKATGSGEGGSRDDNQALGTLRGAHAEGPPRRTPPPPEAAPALTPHPTEPEPTDPPSVPPSPFARLAPAAGQRVLASGEVDAAPGLPLYAAAPFDAIRASWTLGVAGRPELCGQAKAKFTAAAREALPPWQQDVGAGAPYPHNSLARCDTKDYAENVAPDKTLRRAPWGAAEAAGAAFADLPWVDLKAVLLADAPAAARGALEAGLEKDWFRSVAAAVVLGRAHPTDAATVPVWVAPVFLDLPELLRGLATVDVPVRQFVFVENLGSPEKDAALALLAALPFGVAIVRFPDVQAGFAAAMNTGILEGRRWVADPPPPWFFLANADVAYPPGQLRVLASYAHRFHEDYGLIYADQQAHHAFAVSSAAVDAVGLFDESIYPAYMEDVDFRWRVRLCGLGQLVTPAAFAHRPSTNLRARDHRSEERDRYRRVVERNHNNMAYMERKWGYFDQTHIYFHAPPGGGRTPWGLRPEQYAPPGGGAPVPDEAAVLSLWAVDPVQRACIVALATPGTPGDCRFDAAALAPAVVGAAGGAVPGPPPLLSTVEEEERREHVLRAWGCGPVLLPPLPTRRPVAVRRPPPREAARPPTPPPPREPGAPADALAVITARIHELENTPGLHNDTPLKQELAQLRLKQAHLRRHQPA